MSGETGLTGGLSPEGSHLCHCYHHQPIRSQYSDELTNQRPVFITTDPSAPVDHLSPVPCPGARTYYWDVLNFDFNNNNIFTRFLSTHSHSCLYLSLYCDLSTELFCSKIASVLSVLTVYLLFICVIFMSEDLPEESTCCCFTRITSICPSVFRKMYLIEEIYPHMCITHINSENPMWQFDTQAHFMIYLVKEMCQLLVICI